MFTVWVLSATYYLIISSVFRASESMLSWALYCLILTKTLVNDGNYRGNYFLSQIIVLVQGVVIWITYSNHKVTTFKEYEPEEIGTGGFIPS